MNLIKEYLGSIEGLHVFAIISLLVFLTAFVFIIYRTYSLNKEKLNNYSQYPLEDEDVGSN